MKQIATAFESAGMLCQNTIRAEIKLFYLCSNRLVVIAELIVEKRTKRFKKGNDEVLVERENKTEATLYIFTITKKKENYDGLSN